MSEVATSDPGPEAGRNVRLVLTILYGGNLLCLAAIKIKGVTNYPINYWSNIYLVIPLIGACFGFWRLNQARHRRLARHLFVPLLFCTGLLCWAVGCSIWMYYNLALGQEVPYPSFADAWYLGCLLCWTVGLLRFYQLAGANLLEDLRSTASYVVGSSAIVVGMMFWAHGGHLSNHSLGNESVKFLVDVSFPLVDLLNFALLMGLAFGAAYKSLNVEMKKRIGILAGGYFLLLVADLSFNVGTSLPKDHTLAYYNGGLTDLFFSTALYVLAMGVSYISVDRDSGSCLLTSMRSANQ